MAQRNTKPKAKAKRKPKAKKEEAEKLLPLPNALLEHHLTQIQPLLDQWKEQEKVPSSTIISGSDGIGKREMVHYIAQTISCEKAGFSKASTPEEQTTSLFGEVETKAPEADRSARPCGECPACQRSINNRALDFHEVRPESADEATGKLGSIKIHQFDEIKSSQGFGALEGTYKIILIDQADRMTPQTANSLLKLIEEPPRNWIFFLTATDSTLILPTLLSRCQRLRLRPLSDESLFKLLEEKEIPQDRRLICTRLAQGSVRKALEFASEEFWERRRNLFTFIRSPQAELSKLVDWASKDPKHLSLLTDQLEQVTSDLIEWSIAESQENYPWKNQDGKTTLSFYSRDFSKEAGSPAHAREQWLERSEKIQEVRKKIPAPLNRKLLVQELLVPWI